MMAQENIINISQRNLLLDLWKQGYFLLFPVRCGIPGKVLRFAPGQLPTGHCSLFAVSGVAISDSFLTRHFRYSKSCHHDLFSLINVEKNAYYSS